MLFPQWTGRLQQEQMPLEDAFGTERRVSRREGPEQEQPQAEVEAHPRTIQSWKQPWVECVVKLMEQPFRIPSCEVPGAAQRAQTLTCPVLAP